MSQILIILILGLFVAVLLRKKRHRPNRNFIPMPISRSFSTPLDIGKIHPILLQEGIAPIYDSKVIVQYLEYLKQEPLMYPLDPTDNISARLIETTFDGVCDAVVLVFLENSRHENLRSTDWIKRQEKKIYKGIEYMSGDLGNKNYFVGNDFSIADVCGISCLEYLDLRFSKFNWRRQYPNLENYWHTHRDRKSFLETKPSIQIIEPLNN